MDQWCEACRRHTYYKKIQELIIDVPLLTVFAELLDEGWEWSARRSHATALDALLTSTKSVPTAPSTSLKFTSNSKREANSVAAEYASDKGIC